MTLNRRIPRTFLEHKSFYIGLFLLILLASSLFISFRTAMVSIKESVTEDRITSRVEDASFSYSEQLSEEDIAKYEEAYNLVLQASRYADIACDNGATIRIRPEYTKLNLYSVVSGTALSGPGQIMLDRFYVEKHNLAIGDSVDVGGHSFTLCGILAYPDYLSTLKSEEDMMPDASKFGIAALVESDYLVLSNGVEKVYYSVAFREDNAEEFRAELGRNGIVTTWTDANNNERIAMFDSEIDAIIAMAAVAPLVILFVSCLIMGVIMGRMLRREYANIGTLSAMGYKKRDILPHYLILPAGLSLAGSAMGLLLGSFVAEPMEILSKSEYGIPKVNLNFTLANILITLLVPTLFITLFSLLSILRALRIETVILLKANSGKEKKGFLIRLLPFRVGSFRFRFIVKEMISNISRSMLMIIGVGVSTLFILSGFIINSTLDYFVDQGYGDIYSYEYQYILETPNTTDAPDGAESFMLSGFTYAKNGEKYDLVMCGIEMDSRYVSAQDMNGETIPNGVIAISNSVAKRLGISAGDTITIQNDSDRKFYDVPIDVIADVDIGNYIFLDIDQLNGMLGYPEDTHIGYFSSEKLSLSSSDVNSIITKDQGVDALKSSISVMRGVLYILATVAAVIGVIVVYSVTILMIHESAKNISMLQVMGYKKKEISKLLIRSNSVLVWIGFALGVPGSLAIMDAFFHGISKDMNFIFDAKISPIYILISFCFLQLIYYVTLYFTRKSAFNMNLADSLKERD